jgi:hypothetical protein
MNEPTVFAVVSAVAAFAVFLWLLRPRKREIIAPSTVINLQLAGYIPRHYRHFPQVRQSLSAVDARYLREMASPAVAQRALQERREIALQFLSGLREDFANLDRLARMVAALSPAVSHEQETARFLLGLKFQVLYFWVRLRLSAGPAPLEGNSGHAHGPGHVRRRRAFHAGTELHAQRLIAAARCVSIAPGAAVQNRHTRLALQIDNLACKSRSATVILSALPQPVYRRVASLAL